MEQLRTKAQNTQLFALLNALNLVHLRKDLAFQYSGGRTYSSKELTKSECDLLLKKLIEMKAEQQGSDTPAPVLKLRRRFFAVCHELGWEHVGGKLDYIRIDGWLLKYGVFKKKLNEYSLKELPKLISQIDALLKRKLDNGNGNN